MVCRINHRAAFGPVVGYAAKPSKTPELVSSSLCAVTPAEMIEEFQQLARLNSRCKNPCVHVVLSPAVAEQLTGKQWRQICERTAKEYGATQWAAFVHHDTAIPHVSLVLSRIGPDGKAWSTSNDRYRLRRICREFEDEHGLRPTPERSHDIRINKTEVEKAERLCRTGQRPNAVPDRMAVAVAVRAALRQPTLREFEDCLARQKIVTRWRHDEQGRPIGVSYGRGEACISGQHAGVSARMLTVHYSGKGTTTHEQTRRTTVASGTPSMVAASRGGNCQTDTSGLAGQHKSAGAGSSPVERLGRGAVGLSGVDSTPVNTPIREIGGLLCQALTGLQMVTQQLEEDGQRFTTNRQRQFRPRLAPIKAKVVSR